MYIDFDPDLDYLTAIAAHLGFEVEGNDISYSISYSQGDGASFSGSFCMSDKLHIKDHAPQDTSLAVTEECIRKSKRVFWKRICAALPCELVSALRAPLMLKYAPPIHINKESSRYAHESCMRADASDVMDTLRFELGDDYPDDDTDLEEAVNELEENILEDARFLAQDFHRLLTEDFEYQVKWEEEQAAADKAEAEAEEAARLDALERASETAHQVC
jgi:hypothetical protein